MTAGAPLAVAMLGMDYVNTPLAVRERLRLGDAAGVLELLEQLPWPAVVLSTCHRVEVYVHPAEEPHRALGHVGRLLAVRGRLPEGAVAAHAARRTAEEAVRHLVEVACGLRSAVLGEPQVLGQVRDALELARRAGRTDPVLHRLFELAVRAGKQVRSRTRLGSGSPSLARAALAHLAASGLDVARAHLVIVGSGEMAMLALREAAAAGVGRVTLCARRVEPALAAGRATLEAVAGRRPADGRGGSPDSWLQAQPIVELGELLAECDAVISATTAAGPVIGAKTLLQATQRRPVGRPLRIVDLAVPRDVEVPEPLPPGLSVTTVDELVPAAEAEPAATGEVDLEAAYAIAAQGTAAFLEWWRQRQVALSVASMRRRAAELRDEELQWALRRLGARLDEADRAVLLRMAERLTNKLLHLPTLYLKAAAAGGSVSDWEDGRVPDGGAAAGGEPRTAGAADGPGGTGPACAPGRSRAAS